MNGKLVVGVFAIVVVAVGTFLSRPTAANASVGASPSATPRRIKAAPRRKPAIIGDSTMAVKHTGKRVVGVCENTAGLAYSERCVQPNNNSNGLNHKHPKHPKHPKQHH